MSALELAKAAAHRASLKSRPAQRTTAQSATQFEQDFELCMEHFGFGQLERMEALDLAKMDKAGAKECFGSIAASLRRDNTATLINERIKARIEEERKVA